MNHDESVPTSFIEVDGDRRAYVTAGSGPVLVLLHGAGDNHHTWDEALPLLAEHFTVIAPDQLGHGESDKPRADYSIAALANGLRDTLMELGVDRATLVGHSLGGAVALQYAYQFPERTERLVLVAAGGLGDEITPILRIIGLPGFKHVAKVLTGPGVRHALQAGLRIGGRVVGQDKAGRDMVEMASLLDSFRDPDALQAVRQVIRSGIDGDGQVATHHQRSWLANSVPMALMWGTADHMVPVQHAHDLQRAVPTARVEYVEGAGHFPHLTDPVRFAEFVRSFVEETPTAEARPGGRGRRAFRRPGRPLRAVQPRSVDQAG